MNVAAAEVGSRCTIAATSNATPETISARRPSFAPRARPTESAKQANAINAIDTSTAIAAGPVGTASRLTVRDIGS